MNYGAAALAISHRGLKLLSPGLFTAKVKVKYPPKSKVHEWWKSRSPIVSSWAPPQIRPVKEPVITEYWIEEHNAERAGLHYDITVRADDGRYYRWATKDPMWDQFGAHTKMLWLLQPEHTKPNNPAIITEGYGKGTTRVIEHGNCLLYTKNDHLHIVFGEHRGVWSWVPASNLGPKAEKAGGLMVRANPRRIPRTPKNHYKVIGNESVDKYINDSNYLELVKKDGARGNFKFAIVDGEANFSIGSYRQDKRLNKSSGFDEGIDWTDKLRDRVHQIETGFSGSTGRSITRKYGRNNRFVVEGVAEVWLDDFQDLNARLQYNDVTAALQSRRPYIYMFNITSVNGKDWGEVPYREKIALIEAIHEANPNTPLKVPAYASTPIGKRTLLKMARREDGVDGVVFQRLDGNETLKHKWREEITLPIVDVKQEVSITGRPKESAIPIFEYKGREFTSTGKLDSDIKYDMYKNPEGFIGTEADISYTRMSKVENGVPFQPIVERVYVGEGTH
jgi:hypothetical protein